MPQLWRPIELLAMGLGQVVEQLANPPVVGQKRRAFIGRLLVWRDNKSSEIRQLVRPASVIDEARITDTDSKASELRMIAGNFNTLPTQLPSESVLPFGRPRRWWGIKSIQTVVRKRAALRRQFQTQVAPEICPQIPCPGNYQGDQ